MFAPFFFQGAGEEPPTPRDIIGKSLRFRGAQNLNRTFGQNWNNNMTISMWIKRAELDVQQTVMTLDSGANGIPIRYESNNTLVTLRNSDGNTFVAEGTYVDTSAWYHVVVNTNAVYVNGRQVTSGTLIAGSDSRNDCYIGSYGQNNTQFFEGYIADVYLIDGSILPPTTFAKYDDEGVWVPIINDSLKAPGGVYSNFLTAPTTIYTGQDESAVGAFDGNTSTSAVVSNVGPLTFAPEPPIVINQSLEVYVNMSGNGSITFDGTTISPTLAGDYTTVATSGTISSSNPILITGDGSANAALAAIKVDGQVLVDSTFWSASLTTNTSFDSGNPPSQAFDDSTETFAQANGSSGVNATITFAPSTAIPVTTLEVFAPGFTDQTLTFDGNTITFGPATTWVNIPVGNSAVLSASSPLVVTRTTQGEAARVCAFRVNGLELIDGVSSSYGANGFHLQFADPNNIGLDTSGNGNDFTATGFDLSPVGLWSSALFTNDTDTAVPDFNSTQKDFYTAGPDTSAIYGFDGNSATYAGTANPGSWLFWRPTPQTVLSTIALQCNFELESIYINEVLVDWDDVQDGGGGKKTNPIVPFTGSLTNLAWRGKAATFAATVAILQIDGVTYVDNDDGGYDAMQDSPTQNFCTLNPLFARFPILAEANLSTGTNSSWQNVGGTIAFPETGNYYYEFYVNTISPETRVGFQNMDMNQQDGSSGGIAGYWWVGSQGDVQTNGSMTNPGLATWSVGDVVGLQFDRDVDEVRVYLNNSLYYTWDISGVTERLTPFVTTAGANNPINFGQQPFIYPAPAGFTPLQTQNLPEATIPDGRDYFQAITTGPGSGTSYFQGQISIDTPFVADPAEEQPWRWSGGIDYVGVVTLDAGRVFNPLYVWSAASNTGLQIFISEDGQTWTNTGQDRQNGPGVSSYFNGPARYIRFGNGGGTWQADYFQGVGTTDILGFAQTTFPKGLYWIKDIQNANQWQFLSFMTGLGTQDFSSTLTVSGGWSTTYTAAQGFDGSTNTYCQSNNVDTPATFAPVPPVPFTSKLEIFQEFTGDNATWNGNSTGDMSGGGGWHTIYEGSGEISATLPITVNNSQTNNTVGFNAIKVDGQILIDKGQGQVLQCPAAGALTTYDPPAAESIAYCWNSVNDSVINTNGTTPSQVSVDPKSGFSIVKYNGTGSATTIGHGLDKAPEFILIKQTDATRNFTVYSEPTGNQAVLFLNNGNGSSSSSTGEYWNNTNPTSSVFSVGSSTYVNISGGSYVAYCWTSIPGFSAVGRYTGNGNADGPFVYTGFKPSFVLIKAYENVQSGTSWTIFDSTLDPTNPADEYLNPNTTNAPGSSSARQIDFLSNGFKIRGNSIIINNNNNGILYMAFASNPFGGENINPVTAY